MVLGLGRYLQAFTASFGEHRCCGRLIVFWEGLRQALGPQWEELEDVPLRKLCDALLCCHQLPCTADTSTLRQLLASGAPLQNLFLNTGDVPQQGGAVILPWQSSSPTVYRPSNILIILVPRPDDIYTAY